MKIIFDWVTECLYYEGEEVGRRGVSFFKHIPVI